MIKQDNTLRHYRLPAEWEEQDFVQLTWPHGETDWKPILCEITTTYISLAIEIARRQPLVIVSPFPDEIKNYMRHVTTKDVADRIHYVTCPSDDTWARDHAFITLTDGTDCRLLDFRFNGWGDKFEAEKDNAINRHLYDTGLLRGTYESHLDFVLEGGAIESDGQGTIFTTSPCLLAPHRNQPMTREEIEKYLVEALQADRVVWIDHGSLIGDDTDGHIDTLVRIAPDNTILYMACDDPNDEQYAELHLMEEQLRTLRTIDGQPYRLLPLPSPRPILRDGERLPATYANFLIINGAVLVPTYGQPDLDAAAMNTIGKAFPGREIVGLDCSYVVVQHGSLHCCTMQYPKGTLKAVSKASHAQ